MREVMEWVFLFDACGRFTCTDHEASERLGYSCDELLRLALWDIMPAMTEQQVMSKVQPLLAGKTDMLTLETLHQRADGSRLHVCVSLRRTSIPDTFMAVVREYDSESQALKVRQRMRLDNHPGKASPLDGLVALSELLERESLNVRRGAVRHTAANLTYSSEWLRCLVGRACMVDEAAAGRGGRN